MNTYIIEAHPFPVVLGKDKLVKVQSKDNLDIVLEKLKTILEEENQGYEYDLYGYTLENFINEIELIELSS